MESKGAMVVARLNHEGPTVNCRRTTPPDTTLLKRPLLLADPLGM